MPHMIGLEILNGCPQYSPEKVYYNQTFERAVDIAEIELYIPDVNRPIEGHYWFLVGQGFLPCNSTIARHLSCNTELIPSSWREHERISFVGTLVLVEEEGEREVWERVETWDCYPALVVGSRGWVHQLRRHGRERSGRRVIPFVRR